MAWQLDPYSLPLLAAATISAAVGVFVWQRRPAIGAGTLALLMGAVAAWSLGYAIEIASPTLAAKLFWAKWQYPSIVVIPLAWMAFALQFSGHGAWLSWPMCVALLVEPVAMLALVYASEVPGPLYLAADLRAFPSFTMLQTVKGPAFWGMVGYAYLLLLAGTASFVPLVLRTRTVYRGQVVVLLLAVVSPWAANALHLAGYSPVIDLTPFTFTISGGALAWALVHFQLLDLAPVARDIVIEGMPDGVLVLDARNRIVDANAAACRMIGHSLADTVGRAANAVFATRRDLVEQYAHVTDAQAEVAVGDPSNPRTYDLRISPLHDPRQSLTGRLIVLRDITTKKQAEAELQRAKTAAEQAAQAKSDFHTGIGVPADRLARIFQPFTQADASTTREFGGTGLGLAICRRLAELMGGGVTAESRPGQGSTFDVTVQVDAAPGRTKSARPAVGDPAAGRLADRLPLRVLVAEDNHVNQRVALRMLEKMGYRADVAGDGREAVDAVRRQPYDVVLMDVQMPEMDGLTATSRIRDLVPADHQPLWIIAMTASATVGDRNACLAAGMDDYLSKPVRSDSLYAALERAGTALRLTADAEPQAAAR